jgi:hypothetical protein
VTEALPLEVANKLKSAAWIDNLSEKTQGGCTSMFIALLTGNDLWVTPNILKLVVIKYRCIAVLTDRLVQ